MEWGGGGGGTGWHLAAPDSYPARPQLVGAPCWPGAQPPPVAEGGGEGGQVLTRPWLRPARGIAAPLWRLCLMPSRHCSTPEWGPLPPPGRDPPVQRGRGPTPRRGASSWAVSV